MADGGASLGAGPVGWVVEGIAAIVRVLTGTGSSLKAFAHDVTLSLKLAWGAFSGPIRSALSFLKDHVLDLIRRVKKIIDDLKDKIGKIIGPIIKYQKQIRDLWDHLFNRFIAPILQTIQHLRQTLTIFKVFHVKFADALDKRLAGLEGDIASRFLIVKQTINKTLSWLELIADPAGLLKTNVVLRSLGKSFDGLGALLTGQAFRDLTDDEGNDAKASKRDLTDKGRSEMVTRYTTNMLDADDTEFQLSVVEIINSAAR